MESEMLRIFTAKHEPIGVATRAEAHQHGYWHETFHYWLLTTGGQEEPEHIYFQLRSPQKKDYPNLLDITAAGHLLAHEQVEDGVREVEEEIGIPVQMDELTSLGILAYSVKNEQIHDNEHAHVFLHKKPHITFDDFILQESEVSGIFYADLSNFAELWNGRTTAITVKGFVMTNGARNEMTRKVTRQDFVPHQPAFYQELMSKLLTKETTSMITYKINEPITAEQLAHVFTQSGIRRPVEDLPRLQKMLDHADLTITAWAGDRLVGVARAVTDFSYCCYLSDLAVDQQYQKHGIGKELVRLVKEQIGDEISLILLSSPVAMDYYPKIGFTKIENGYMIPRK